MDVLLRKTEERSFSFTLKGSRKLTEKLTKRNPDAGLVYETLRDEMKTVPFHEYLKRYIYLNSSMTGPFREIPNRSYQLSIMESFRENGVPPTMEDSDVRLATVTSRWLEQYRVSREAVILLGFGLSMTLAETEDFLTNALHDHRLDPAVPMEGICRYCLENGYGWDRFRWLKRLYEEGAEAVEAALPTYSPAELSREGRRRRMDRELLLGLLDRNGKDTLKEKTRALFTQLYARVKQQIALESSQGLSPEKLTLKHVETVFCPIDKRDCHGNLQLSLQPSVRRELSGKRFTKHHIYQTITGKREPDRYDLMTLNLYLWSGAQRICSPKKRLEAFRRDMNEQLEACGYGALYAADPFDNFIQMAVNSAEPMDTYLNVMELARVEEPAG